MPPFKPRNTERARALRREATPVERALWEHLSRRQTGAKFSRQMPVGPFFADFLCRELALVVELDGFSHDVAPERDAHRDAWMAREGFTVLRFTNDDVRGNIEGVVTAIRLEVERLRGRKGRGSAHP
jgi:BirA family biotin operon repressor/biotin-[acetyl-CoA-carboxylase] ligase